MPRVLAHRPSPAMLVALLALFVSLGGSAYAALNLPKNSVGTRQLKNGAVTTKKLKNGAVTAGKLRLKGLTVPAATYATNATNATNAANANELGGRPAPAYAASSLLGNPASFSQGSASDTTQPCVIGEIKLFAGIPPAGVMIAAGQTLQISSNPALYTALGGNTYGGNGTTTFALPDLRGAEPKGQGPHGVSYYICTTGLYP